MGVGEARAAAVALAATVAGVAAEEALAVVAAARATAGAHVEALKEAVV